MRNNEAFTGHKKRIGNTGKPVVKSRYDRISRERWLQRNREDAERRKKLNPRIVMNDPDVFFHDILMEQQEQS